MAQITFSVRMEEGLKRQFDSLCSELGLNASTAFNIFAKASVREKRIPIDLKLNSSKSDREDFYQAFESLRSQALEKYPNGMSLEEINEIIDKTRKGED